jgi:outer membrane protein assembly factor BamB
LFGSADGYVYCLRASDGALAWRFRAAPEDRRLVAYEQVESVWPVPGNVLVHDGIAWCVAGRSMFLDGGLHLLRLDAKTGRLLSETILDERVPETNENLQSHVRQLNMPVALPDVLSCDGRYVYMRSQRFDLEGRRQDIGPRELRDQLGEGAHLFSPTGFLDDTWWHRSYWIFGRTFMQGAGGWPQAGKVVPAGRILAFDGETIYGFGRQPDYYKWTTPVEHQLFAAGKQPREVPVREPAAKTAKSKAAARKAAQNPKRAGLAVDYRWTTPVPLYVRAMVLAGPTLWFAGPPELVSEADAFRKANDPAMLAQLRQQDEAFEGKRGALLWAVSAADGKQLGQWRLESLPVFDGMIAADARLYLSTSDGRVLCMGGR